MGWWLLVGVCAAMSGCSGQGLACDRAACGALPPAITFHVIDALDAGTISGARINSWPCANVCAGRLQDGGVIEQAGTFDFMADAPGYWTVTFEIDVPAATPVDGQCCGIPFVPQPVDLPLMPL